MNSEYQTPPPKPSFTVKSYTLKLILTRNIIRINGTSFATPIPGVLFVLVMHAAWIWLSLHQNIKY